MKGPLSTEAVASLARHLCDSAPPEGGCAIVRAQEMRRRELVVAEGRLEQAESVLARGLGAHVFDVEGRSAFTSADGWGESAAEELPGRGLRALELARRAGAAENRAVLGAEPCRAVTNPDTPYAFDHLGLQDVAARLLDVNREVAACGPGLRVRTRFLIQREEWRILRTDGTDVVFVMPRAALLHHLALGEGGRVMTAATSGFGASYEVLLDDAAVARSVEKARAASETLGALLEADDFEGGSHPIVMDHALAKVLAHEAFGHASESDSLRSSILAREGRFRTGEVVACRELSLVDEPREGDWACQPWSSNGVRRRAAVIIRDGVVHEALADLFSAEAAGVPVTGAARAETYRAIPMPRMTNIRIEMKAPVPFAHEGEAPPRPEAVREALLREGLLGDAQPRVVYLTGFRGGQVNTIGGEFVFNCLALYELTRDGFRLYKPAIFSGSCLEALKSIRTGFGELALDAMGTCGKGGQGVPSSGGSHRLLYMDACPAVRLGGA